MIMKKALQVNNSELEKVTNQNIAIIFCSFLTSSTHTKASSRLQLQSVAMSSHWFRLSKCTFISSLKLFDNRSVIFFSVFRVSKFFSLFHFFCSTLIKAHNFFVSNCSFFCQER